MKAEKELMRLMKQVQAVTQKMDELEYDKNTSKRMRNVILREFGKKVEELKIDPFEVMLDKVEKKSTEEVRKSLSQELTNSFEYLIVELVKDFRKEFTKELNNSQKVNQKQIEKMEKDMNDLNSILEKKVAIMEEDMFKKVSELDDKNEEVKGNVKKLLKKIQARINTIDSNLSSEGNTIKEIKKELGQTSKLSDKLDKRVASIEKDFVSLDVDKKIENSVKEINTEFQRIKKELKTDINSLKNAGRTLLEKDISHIWKEIEGLKKIVSTDDLEKEVKQLRKEKEQLEKDIDALIEDGDFFEKEINSLRKELENLKDQFEMKPTKMVDKIEKLEKEMEPIKSKKVAKGLERIDALEKMVMDALKPKKGGKK